MSILPKREAVIGVRITAEEREMLVERARASDVPLSEAVRRAVQYYLYVLPEDQLERDLGFLGDGSEGA